MWIHYGFGYRGTKSKKVYIGQTSQFEKRHSQHYDNTQAGAKKFQEADFNRVLVVYSRYFEGSALDDVESQLITQFRIQASGNSVFTSEDYVNGIKYLLYKDTDLLKSEFTNFNPNFNRGIFSDHSEDAYFTFFREKPLKNLIDWVEQDTNCNHAHINRVLAGLVEKWKQSDGEDSNIKHWVEDGIARRWNSKQENWINSKDEDAEDQIGSVFAVQGIDLNKVGVLIGCDLEVTEHGTLRANPNKFHSVNGVFSKEEMQDLSNQQEFTLFVLNIYYVLLTRGIDGVRLGFWKNDKFMDYMIDALEIK